MIKITKVRELLKEQVEAEFEEKLAVIEKDSNSHKDVMVRVLAAQEQAQSELPTILAMLENRIKKAVSSNVNNTISYTFDETYKDTFVVSLLISVFTLNGFSCKLRANKLDISW